MSFWNTSDNQKIEQTTTFEAGGAMEPIPNNTQVKASIDDVKWDHTDNGDEFISIQWSVLAPEEYKNRKVFQKLWVMGNNPNSKDPAKQGDKAKRMLAAINTNAKGNLMTLDRAPTDQDLKTQLAMKPMALNLMVWEMTDNKTGEQKSGNWVNKVAPLNQQSAQQQPVQPVQQQPQQQQSPDFDDDVGF